MSRSLVRRHKFTEQTSTGEKLMFLPAKMTSSWRFRRWVNICLKFWTCLLPIFHNYYFNGNEQRCNNIEDFLTTLKIVKLVHIFFQIFIAVTWEAVKLSSYLLFCISQDLYKFQVMQGWLISTRKNWIEAEILNHAMKILRRLNQYTKYLGLNYFNCLLCVKTTLGKLQGMMFSLNKIKYRSGDFLTMQTNWLSGSIIT